MKGPVTQAWTHTLTFMQQTVLLTAVRGPDGIAKYSPPKMLLRWYRRCILVSSLDGEVLDNPFDTRGGSFMGPSFAWPRYVDSAESLTHRYEPDHEVGAVLDGLVSEYLQALDGLPHHFQLHFMHAAEMLGFKHPDLGKRSWWNRTYLRLVHDMHLFPESEEQLDYRLGDDRSQWLARNDMATVA